MAIKQAAPARLAQSILPSGGSRASGLSEAIAAHIPPLHGHAKPSNLDCPQHPRWRRWSGQLGSAASLLFPIGP